MRARLRRLAFVAPVAVVTAASASLALGQMAADGAVTPLDLAMLVLLTVSMAYAAAQSWQVALGLLVALRGGRPVALPEVAGPASTYAAGLAVVVPVCDEDVAAVFGAVAVVRRSMARAGLGAAQVFVLSDSRDASTVRAEGSAFAAAVRRGGPDLPRLRYRHRAVNARRKAGNVAEFLAASGRAFELMLVLDADSLMGGEAIARMVRMMAASPRLGLLQSLCFPARRGTLFARAQQFAARAYAPLHVMGLAWWAGAEGVYWGHNAMIRVAPFRDHCGLPVLPGRPPLGGEVLCHDVVEAAFLRRAGWEVRVVAGLEGTWEDMPSNTLDFAVRDRRWCQGNLQHLRLLGEPGLAWPSRYHLVNGIMGYASAPIWVAFLLCGTLQLWLGRGAAVGSGGGTLLAPAVAAPVLFWLSMGVVFGPKLLGAAHVLTDAGRRRAFGGAGRFAAGLLAETLFGFLWGPMTLLLYGRFVLVTLAGGVVSWDPQARGDRGVGWAEAARRHVWHTAFGVVWGAVTWGLDPAVFWWMSPILAGLVLSAPLTVLSSRTGPGRAARRLGLFLTPDEVRPAPELLDLPGEIARAARDVAGEPPVAGRGWTREGARVKVATG